MCRELAEECGIKSWKRVPALNTDKDFIVELADIVEEALGAPRMSLRDTCILRQNKNQEGVAYGELNKELRYLNTSAFNDPISHIFGWRVGKVTGRLTGKIRELSNMLRI